MCSTGFWAIFIHRLPVIWGFSRMKHLITHVVKEHIKDYK